METGGPVHVLAAAAGLSALVLSSTPAFSTVKYLGAAYPVVLQTLTLGALFLGLATLSDGTYALLAGTVGRRLQGNRTFARRQKYVTSGVYLALGVGTATTGHG